MNRALFAILLLLTVLAMVILFGLEAKAETINQGEFCAIEWDANSEPDFSYYRVYWQKDSGGFQAVAQQTTTDLTCDNAGMPVTGAFTVYVIAVDDAGNPSGPSNNLIFQRSQALPPATIPQANISAIFASSDDAAMGHVLDGNINTSWTALGDDPKEIVMALSGTYELHEFEYTPYIWTKCTVYEIYISMTNGNWGTSVASGTWPNNTAIKTVQFPATTGQFIRIVYNAGVSYCYAAEHNFVGSLVNFLNGNPTNINLNTEVLP